MEILVSVSRRLVSSAGGRTADFSPSLPVVGFQRIMRENAALLPWLPVLVGWLAGKTEESLTATEVLLIEASNGGRNTHNPDGSAQQWSLWAWGVADRRWIILPDAMKANKKGALESALGEFEEPDSP